MFYAQASNNSYLLLYQKSFMRKLAFIIILLRLFVMHYIYLVLVFFSSMAFSETSAIDQRIKDEAKSEQFNFSIIPHKPNYIMPIYFNEKIADYAIYQGSDGKSSSQRTEIKFQISLKVPLFQKIGNLPISGYVAYTQLSYWQAYNTEYSSPFRETNYEPEAFILWETDQELGLGWRFKAAQFGFTHQSNGRTEPTSRSWNRLDGSLLFDKGNFVVSINPWYRFEDSDDDNPDLLDFYGHGQIITAYKYNEHVYSLTSRNNIESGFSKGAVTASWSFPIYGKIKGYVQVFSGYGNSLLEYNEYTNTIGLGISISDFL